MPPLSSTARVLLLVLGWLLILLGLIGLFLPGLQGLLTLVAGAAALSLVSPTIFKALRMLLRPWPRLWRTILRMRRRVHRWLLDRFEKSDRAP